MPSLRPEPARSLKKPSGFGFDFALSMIKLHGFGGTIGVSGDHNLESFTLMAGIAAVTKRIELFRNLRRAGPMPPPIAARMAVTIDSIAPGPGSGVKHHLRLAARGIRANGESGPAPSTTSAATNIARNTWTIMKELWSTGALRSQGATSSRWDDCRCSPLPVPGKSRSSARPQKRCRKPAMPQRTPTTISA